MGAYTSQSSGDSEAYTDLLHFDRSKSEFVVGAAGWIQLLLLAFHICLNPSSGLMWSCVEMSSFWARSHVGVRLTRLKMAGLGKLGSDDQTLVHSMESKELQLVNIDETGGNDPPIHFETVTDIPEEPVQPAWGAEMPITSIGSSHWRTGVTVFFGTPSKRQTQADCVFVWAVCRSLQADFKRLEGSAVQVVRCRLGLSCSINGKPLVVMLSRVQRVGLTV